MRRCLRPKLFTLLALALGHYSDILDAEPHMPHSRTLHSQGQLQLREPWELPIAPLSCLHLVKLGETWWHTAWVLMLLICLDGTCLDVPERLCHSSLVTFHILSYRWVVPGGYRRVFCQYLKRQKNTQQIQPKNTKSELQGLENTTGWFCIFFVFWFLISKSEHGVGSLAYFWICLFFVFCIFKILGSYFFCILYFWNCWFVCFLYFVFLRSLPSKNE